MRSDPRPKPKYARDRSGEWVANDILTAWEAAMIEATKKNGDLSAKIMQRCFEECQEVYDYEETRH